MSGARGWLEIRYRPCVILGDVRLPFQVRTRIGWKRTVSGTEVPKPPSFAQSCKILYLNAGA